MEIVKIYSVETSKKKNIYCTSASGDNLQLRLKTMKPEVGQFALVQVVEQTHSYNDPTDPNKLNELTTPVKVNRIMSLWKTKAEAKEALLEKTRNKAEVAADIEAIGKEFSLTSEKVAELQSMF